MHSMHTYIYVNDFVEIHDFVNFMFNDELVSVTGNGLWPRYHYNLFHWQPVLHLKFTYGDGRAA